MSPSQIRRAAESMQRHNDKIIEIYMRIEEAAEGKPESLASLFLEGLRMNQYPNWAHPLHCLPRALKKAED